MSVKSINLSLNIIINECSTDSNLNYDHFLYFSSINRENIHETFKYKKFRNDFVDMISCVNEDDYIIGSIKPSYEFFLKSLLKILNIKKVNYQDDDALTKEMLKQIDKLLNIKTEKELKQKFPELYKDLIAGRQYFNSLQIYKRQEDYSREQYADGEHYFYSCGLQKSLKRFITNQAKMYQRYITNRRKLKELQEKTNYNAYIRKHFDINKLAMYVIYETLTQAEFFNKSEIKECLSKAAKYINSKKYKKSVTLNINNEIINFKYIVEKYNYLINLYKEKNKIVEWELIPSGEQIKKYSKTNNSRVTIMNIDELNRLRELGKEKEKFYESTNCYAKAIGLKKYKGYIAYIYENGEVLLDTIYNDEYPKTATGNAIYNLKICDFRALSRLDKKQLKAHENVKCIYHSGNWIERVSAIIEREATEEEKKYTHEYVHFLK